MTDVLDSVFAQESKLPLNVASYRPDVREMLAQSPIQPQAIRDAITKIDPNAGPQLDARQFASRDRFIASPSDAASQPTTGVQPAPASQAAPPQDGLNRAERLQAEDTRRAQAARGDEERTRIQNQRTFDAWPAQQERILQEFDARIAAYKRAEQDAISARNYRDRQEARQARKDAEEKRDKIAAAFATIGRALGSSRGGGGGGIISSAGGGGDDPNAFRAGVIQRRPPPQIRISPPPRVELPSLARK